MKDTSNMNLNRLMEELAAVETSEFPLISLYLNAQAGQHGRDNFEPFVRKELNNRVKSFAEDSPERKSFSRDIERINDYLTRKLPPSANGAAIFACAGADDFFKAVHFEAPIPANEMQVSDRPYLYPLARIVDQHPSYAVLVADTDAARIFVVDMGRITRRLDIDNTGRNLAPAGVWTQLRFERRLENYNSLHAKEVVEELDRIVLEEAVDLIVLGGDEVIVPLLQRYLPARLSDIVTEVLPLDIRASEHEILRASMESVLDDNTQSDAEKVRDLFDSHRAGGLAVVGMRETLEALLHGRVDELLLTAVPNEIRIDDGASGLLSHDTNGSLAGRNDSAEQKASAAGMLVTHAILTRAAITFIEDPMLLSEIGGVGAFLRYRD